MRSRETRPSEMSSRKASGSLAEAFHLRRAGKTHIGLVRAENQDNLTQFDSPFGEVLLVADGMGGVQGGAAAARMVVEGFQQQLTSLPASMPVSDALRRATRSVADQVHAVGRGGDPQYAGMGSTVVMAIVSGSTLVVAHIGDSRAYLYRGKKLMRITRDHTAVQRMVDSGMISEHEARDHPNASVLSRAIGPDPAVEIEVSKPIEMKPADGVLLCSDGLSGYIDDPVIEGTLAQFPANPEEATSALIQLALNAGGEDNVTVQYLHFQAHRPTLRERMVVSPSAVANPAGWRQLLRNPMLFAAVILLTVLAAFGLGWAFRDRFSFGGGTPGQGVGKSSPVGSGAPAKPAPSGPAQVTPPQTAPPAESGELPGSGPIPAVGAAGGGNEKTAEPADRATSPTSSGKADGKAKEKAVTPTGSPAAEKGKDAVKAPREKESGQASKDAPAGSTHPADQPGPKVETPPAEKPKGAPGGSGPSKP